MQYQREEIQAGKFKIQSSCSRTNGNTIENEKIAKELKNIRTLILLVLRELALESPIDHVSEAVVTRSRQRRVLRRGIDLLLRHRVRLVRLGGGRGCEFQPRNTEEKETEQSEESEPHCRGLDFCGAQ